MAFLLTALVVSSIALIITFVKEFSMQGFSARMEAEFHSLFVQKPPMKAQTLASPDAWPYTHGFAVEVRDGSVAKRHHFFADETKMQSFISDVSPSRYSIYVWSSRTRLPELLLKIG